MKPAYFEILIDNKMESVMAMGLSPHAGEWRTE
jgi:hypothetical protein